MCASALGCTAAPEQLSLEAADAQHAVALEVPVEPAEVEPAAARPVDWESELRRGTPRENAQRIDPALDPALDPSPAAEPMLWRAPGSAQAWRRVEGALADGRRPRPADLRPDRMLKALAPKLDDPARRSIAVYGETVICPWNLDRTLVVVGISTDDDEAAAPRAVSASLVWNWMLVDAMRMVGESEMLWHRQEATPWAADFARLPAGTNTITMFETGLYAGAMTHAAPGAPGSITDHLVKVRIGYADPYATPSELAGRLQARPTRWPDNTSVARHAVAVVAWARKLRGDDDLRGLTWAQIRALVPDDDDVDEVTRDALLTAIDRSARLDARARRG